MKVDPNGHPVFLHPMTQSYMGEPDVVIYKWWCPICGVFIDDNLVEETNEKTALRSHE